VKSHTSGPKRNAPFQETQGVAKTVWKKIESNKTKPVGKQMKRGEEKRHRLKKRDSETWFDQAGRKQKGL